MAWQVKLPTSLLILALALPSAPPTAAETPTLDDIRRAAELPSTHEPLLTRWLDGYPDSAAGWSADDLRIVVAHLVGAGLAHHPAAPEAAVEQARRHADQQPFQLDPAARSFSLAARLLLQAGHNERAESLLDEGLGFCHCHLAVQGAFASELGATSCAFLVRDHVLLEMRLGRPLGLAEELRDAMGWLDPYPRSDAWIPLLNTAADVACWHGEVADCLDHYRRATDFARDLLGETHETTAYGYLGQGWAAALAHQWGTARAAFDQAERIWSDHLGPEHPRLADVLVEYGELLRQSGDAAGAVSVLRRAVGLREARLGPAAFDLPRALDALGLSYLDLGDFDLAEQALARAAEIRQKELDIDHIDHVRSWNALAWLAQARGQAEMAEGLLARSLARLSARLGADHAATAEASLRLAALVVRSAPIRAKDLATEARSALTRAYGRDHPAVGRAWWLVARAESALGFDPLSSALQAEALGRRHVRRIAVGLSEQDLIQYLDVRPQGADLALEALVGKATASNSAERILRVWEEVARSRALVFDTLSERRESLAASERGELSRARQALAHLLVASADDQHASYAERLRAARERVEREERAQSLHVGEASTTASDSRSLDLRRVLAGLAADESLVAYRIFDAKDGPRLAAFLAAGGAANPAVLDLGAWPPIEHELRRWRSAFRSSTEEEYRRAAVALRERLWDPVAARIRTGRCYLVPDGPLFLLPFVSLPIGNGYLVERGPVFHYLGAERDLLESGPERIEPGRVVIFGDPDFGDIEDGAPPGPSTARLRRFEPLPGARQEVGLVAEAWKRWVPESQVEQLAGPDATEEAWRRKAPSAVALHLATHGFVLGGSFSHPSSSPSSNQTGSPIRAVGGLVEWPDDSPPEPPLSGFALAGANQAGAGAATADGSADGIVTLDEIRQLDLHGTQLVVLSFCDSGLGETLHGEGIFGFARTLRSVGVRSMVLALAPISDRDSLRFMDHFYSGLLGRRLAVDTALHEASLALLSELRSTTPDTHPRRWGAMVSIGARPHQPG